MITSSAILRSSLVHGGMQSRRDCDDHKSKMSSQASKVINLLRGAFHEGVLHSIASRKTALRAIVRMMEENEDAIMEALMKDLHRPKHETLEAEILPIILEANLMLSNIDAWTKDEYTQRTFLSVLDTTYIQREPYGMVLIFGSWNYPFLLVITPLIGAIAAGNTAVIKPSEFSPASSSLIAQLVHKYLDERVCQVLEGDVEFSQRLLKEERFDYIFFTGSYEAGRSVYLAAADHVTPVTLELGGKCPSYVDSSVSMTMAVKRILFTKLMNAGQTCVATDYILCHKDSMAALRETVCRILKEFLGDDPKESTSFSRIVNERHFKRLTHLLANTRGKILCGGESSEEDLYVAPTVLVNVPKDDVSMREEIFGPILPIVEVESAAEAIEFISSKNKPLAVYVYTDDANVFANFKHGTSSGAICQNDSCSYLLLSQLPFGGVGSSGFGNYHGRFSLETFSHKRSVHVKSRMEVIYEKFAYPPYTPEKLGWARWLLSSSERSSCTLL